MFSYLTQADAASAKVAASDAKTRAPFRPGASRRTLRLPRRPALRLLKGRRRRTECPPEMPTQVRLIAKAARRRHLRQRHRLAPLRQQLAGAVQAHPQQVLVGRAAGGLLKATREMARAQPGLGGQILQAHRLDKARFQPPEGAPNARGYGHRAPPGWGSGAPSARRPPPGPRATGLACVQTARGSQPPIKRTFRAATTVVLSPPGLRR
jgi:hypothetical protein